MIWLILLITGLSIISSLTHLRVSSRIDQLENDFYALRAHYNKGKIDLWPPRQGLISPVESDVLDLEHSEIKKLEQKASELAQKPRCAKCFAVVDPEQVTNIQLDLPINEYHNMDLVIYLCDKDLASA